MSLQDVKAGDKVGIVTGSIYGTRIFGPLTVERAAKTRIYTTQGAFRRNGTPFNGGPWSTTRTRCEPWTEKMAKEQADAAAVTDAVVLCGRLSRILNYARGENALRLVALMSDELKAEAAPKET